MENINNPEKLEERIKLDEQRAKELGYETNKTPEDKMIASKRDFLFNKINNTKELLKGKENIVDKLFIDYSDKDIISIFNSKEILVYPKVENDPSDKFIVFINDTANAYQFYFSDNKISISYVEYNKRQNQGEKFQRNRTLEISENGYTLTEEEFRKGVDDIAKTSYDNYRTEEIKYDSEGKELNIDSPRKVYTHNKDSKYNGTMKSIINESFYVQNKNELIETVISNKDLNKVNELINKHL